jgi:hypothetical protein
VISQRIRKRIDEAFGWAKTVAGLRKMRHRGLPKVDWQFPWPDFNSAEEKEVYMQ